MNTKEKIKALLPFRKRLGEGESLNSFFIVKKDFWDKKDANIEESVKIHIGAPCLARVSRWSYDSSKMEPITFPLSFFCDNSFNRCLKTQKGFTSVQKTYLSWLLNESVWRDIYLTKNLATIGELGIVYDVSFPAQFVISGAILTRYVSEFPDLIERWEKFKEYMDPHIALCMAKCTWPRNNGFSFNDNNYRGHTAFEINNISPKEVVKMIQRKPCFDGLVPMSKDQKFRNMASVWTGDRKITWKHQWKFPKGGETQEITPFGTYPPYKAIIKFEYSNLKAIAKEFLSLNKLEKYYVK